MKRLVFVLALTGSLATDARAEDATTVAVNSGVPYREAGGGGSANLRVRKKCGRSVELDLPRAGRDPAGRGKDGRTSFRRAYVGIRRWVARCGRRGEQGAGQDRQGHSLVETLGQGTPEFRSRRRRNIDLDASTRRGASSRELATTKANSIRSRTPRPIYSRSKDVSQTSGQTPLLCWLTSSPVMPFACGMQSGERRWQAAGRPFSAFRAKAVAVVHPTPALGGSRRP